MKMITSIGAALLLGMSLHAQTTHIYVDATKGIDSNPGTKTLPYKTLTKAITAKKANAVVHVQPGIYGPATTGDFWNATTKVAKSINMVGYTNFEIVGADRATCIIDFNNKGGVWGFLVVNGAATSGVEIHNLTFKNVQDTSAKLNIWGSGAIWTWTGSKINIHHNEFVDALSAVVVYGGTDSAVHNNLFRHTTVPAKWTPVAIRCRITGTTGRGDRVSIYNNQVYGLTAANVKLGHGISWSNDVSNPTQWVANNIVIGCDKGYPDAKVGPNVTVESNIAFNCTANFGVATLPKTNVTVDPKLVNPAKGDFHQAAGSPCYEAGYAKGLAFMDNDWYGSNRAVDNDRNGSTIPDIGLEEVGDLTMTVKNWTQGKVAIFTLGRKSSFGYGGVFLMGAGRGGLLLPGIGVLGMSPLQIVLVTSTTIPGAVALPIPVNPNLKNLRASVQAMGFRAVSGKLRFEMTAGMDLLLD